MLSSILDHEVNRNPYPYLAELRAIDGLVWDDRWRGWVATRHADVRALLVDQHLTAERLPNIDGSTSKKASAAADVMARWVVFMDPPRHTEVRSQIVPGFSPRAIREMRATIEGTFEELMAELRGKSDLDFVSDVAFPFPTRIIGRLFGVPDSDLAQFGEWSDDVAKAMHAGREDVDKVIDSLMDLTTYLEETLHGSDHSALIESLRGLSDADLIATCVLLLFAGHETTKNLLGNTVVTLSDNPEQWARVVADGGLVPAAVDEVLRLEGPAKGSVRLVDSAFTFGDVRLLAGQKLLISFAGANRDSLLFEEPDEFRLDRPNARSVAFGHGIHYCVGAPLARLETQVALDGFRRHWSSFRGDVEPGARHWQDRLLNRGLEELPVRVEWA